MTWDNQVCKRLVPRNTERLVEALRSVAKEDGDGSLRVIGVTPEQAVADLERYLRASPPREGEKANVAYRMRWLLLDRWNLWRRLTRYRSWKGQKGEQIDGTNHAAERAIGGWVKERYRSMRGYKREASAVHVSRLLAWCGNQLHQGGASLALRLA